MAITFTTYTSSEVGTSPATVATIASGKVATIIGMQLANVTDSQISVTVTIAGDITIKGVPIPANSAFSPISGKMNVQTGDTIVVVSDTADSVNVTVSAMEQDI